MPRRAFTLIEILAVVAILAMLITVAVFTFISITSWARTTADKSTLNVLNTALTGYKTTGGGTTALTAGSNISSLLSRMRSSTTWGEGSYQLTHQFLNTAETYPARSLSAVGNGAAYAFYRYHSFTERTPSSTEPTDTYPYGQGVGYLSNNNHASGYSIIAYTTSTSYFAVKQANGTITTHASGSTATIPQSSGVTIWSCTGSGNSTPAGYIHYISAISNNLVSVDVQGLTSLSSLYVQSNALTSLKAKNLASLQYLIAHTNQLTFVDLTGLSALRYLQLHSNLLSSISVNHLSNLISFTFYSNPNLTTLTVSGLNNLTTLSGGFNSSQTSLTVTDCAVLTSIGTNHCTPLTSFTLSNCPSLNSVLVYNTSLSAASLDAMYTALPNRTSLSAGSTNVANTPGRTSDTPSIATAKNWTVLNS